MTVGGTGDVLAGIIASLMSKNVQPYQAARMGAFINGYAGNLAYKNRSYGLIATDIIDKIPDVLKKFILQIRFCGELKEKMFHIYMALFMLVMKKF